jgi:hypothetical protein
MKHSLAVVASLVATFVLGAVVALYGFGPSLTADATGCFGLRTGSVQQKKCVEQAIDACDTEYGEANRNNFNTCLKARIGGRLLFDETQKSYGEPQRPLIHGGQN